MIERATLKWHPHTAKALSSPEYIYKKNCSSWKTLLGLILMDPNSVKQKKIDCNFFGIKALGHKI